MSTTTTTTATASAPLTTPISIGNQGSKPTCPAVPTFENTASIDEIVAGIRVAGGCIIKNAVATDALDTIE